MIKTKDQTSKQPEVSEAKVEVPAEETLTNFDVICSIKPEEKEACLDSLIDHLTRIFVNEVKRMNSEQDCFLDVSNFDKAEIETTLRTFFNTSNTKYQEIKKKFAAEAV